MIRILRPALIGIAGASVLAAAGCAGRRGPTPEIATLEPYNGEWAIAATPHTQNRVQFASGDGYGFTSQTGQTIGAVMGMRAERFVLEVSDSIFRVSGDEPNLAFSLPMDGTPVEVHGEDGEAQQSVTLSWDEGTPVVRRTFPGVGWVSERFELTADGVLVITRTAAMRNYRGSEVRGTGTVEVAYHRSTRSRP